MPSVSLKTQILEKQNELSRFRQHITNKIETIKRVKKDKEAFEAKVRNCEREIRQLEELLILENGLPSQVTILRNTLVAMKERALLETITIAEKKFLDQDVVGITKNLQQICPHTFVLQVQDCYFDSFSPDQDRSHYGIRICIICGLNDISSSYREEIFAILYKGPNQLVKRDLRDKAKRGLDWDLPLNAYLETFKRSAGNPNAEWAEGIF